jgi:hypothetical protein
MAEVAHTAEVELRMVVVEADHTGMGRLWNVLVAACSPPRERATFLCTQACVRGRSNFRPC